jgi:hypothetical protein
MFWGCAIQFDNWGCEASYGGIWTINDATRSIKNETVAESLPYFDISLRVADGNQNAAKIEVSLLFVREVHDPL